MRRFDKVKGPALVRCGRYGWRAEDQDSVEKHAWCSRLGSLRSQRSQPDGIIINHNDFGVANHLTGILVFPLNIREYMGIVRIICLPKRHGKNTSTMDSVCLRPFFLRAVETLGNLYSVLVITQDIGQREKSEDLTRDNSDLEKLLSRPSRRV